MSGDWRPATQVPGERSAFDNPCEYCGDRIVNHSPNELKSCFDDLSARADYLYRDLKGALERLCRAQTHLPAHWRSDAQQAINIVRDLRNIGVNALSTADHDFCDACGKCTVVTDVWIDRAPMTLCQPCVLDALTAEGEHLGQYWEIES